MAFKQIVTNIVFPSLMMLFSVLFNNQLLAQKLPVAKDISTVKESMKAQEASWNEGDIKGFMAYYWKSDSLKFIGSKGITYGWQKTLDNYIKSYPDQKAMGMLTFTIVEATSLSSTSIYVIGQWALQKEKPTGGYFTLLWKKIKGQWVIVADHTS